MCELRAAVSVLHTVDVGPQNSRIFLCALVISTEILGQLLTVVEQHGVHLAVLPNDCVQPQLLHEEHLVGEVLWTNVYYIVESSLAVSPVHALVCESGACPYMVCESGACPYMVCAYKCIVSVYM